jgi:hypothetical protein
VGSDTPRNKVLRGIRPSEPSPAGYQPPGKSTDNRISRLIKKKFKNILVFESGALSGSISDKKSCDTVPSCSCLCEI